MSETRGKDKRRRKTRVYPKTARLNLMLPNDVVEWVRKVSNSKVSDFILNLIIADRTKMK